MAAAESSTWQSAALRLGLALGLAGVIAYRGVRKRSLSIDGALGAGAPKSLCLADATAGGLAALIVG